MFSSFIMSSRKVVINGVTYIRSRDAAAPSTISSDDARAHSGRRQELINMHRLMVQHAHQPPFGAQPQGVTLPSRDAH